MIESKYYLTFDLRILYCPNPKLALSCKELNQESLEFTYYEDDLDILDTSYELEADNIDVLVKKILNGEIGTELPLKEMNWIKLFESELKRNECLLNNDNLMFNYLVLKFRLLGFNDDFAKDIVLTYFKYKRENRYIPSLKNFIKCIDKKLSNKVFWICNDLQNEENIEYEFLKTVLSNKSKLHNKFDFNIFKDQYLKVCEKSFIPKIIKFNETPSYLIKSPMDISDQKHYLMIVYNMNISRIIHYLIDNEYKNLAQDERFIRILINDMSSILRLYLKIKETQYFRK